MNKIFITFLFVTLALTQQQISFPGIVIPQDTLIQVRRAHKYSQHQLNLYQYKRTSKYTLYLALENYAQILTALRTYILQYATNYIYGNNNLVIGQGNIVIGSDNKLAGNDNWIMTSKQVTSKEIQNDVLYIGKWRVRLDLIPEIQYRPSVAIQDMEDTDRDIIRNMRCMNDFRQFSWRKNLRRKLL